MSVSNITVIYKYYDKLNLDPPSGIKGTHTVCFSISFYDVNQMPMSPRTNFHCETTRSACSSG